MSAPREAATLRGARGVVALVAGMAAMTILDLSKTTVALPALEIALGADALQLQLVVAAYVCAYAITLVPGGILGDALGRRRTIALALSIGLVAAVGAAAAQGAPVLIAFRIVQGVAAGLLMPQLMGSLHALFAGPARGRAFGAYGATVSASIALGPVVGGALLLLGDPSSSWRWLFLMNIPPILAALLLVRRLLPPDAAPRRPAVDGLGLLFASGGLALLLVPLILTSGTDADTPARWLLLVPAAALLALFAGRQRTRGRQGRSTVIAPELVRIRTFRAGLGVAGLWFAANLGIAVVVTLYLQGAYGLTPLQAGLANVPSALAAAVSAAVAGRLVSRLGRATVVIGLTIAVSGIVMSCLALLLLAPEQRLVAVILTQTVAGFGGGMTVSPNQALTLGDVPRSLSSAAGSLAQLSQRVGNAAGVAGAGASLFAAVFAAGVSLA
ncbi:MAG TPA: MFS transporter, partial [Microbacterium sp.]|nr:MFS transporter [Microbacterium sp.]